MLTRQVQTLKEKVKTLDGYDPIAIVKTIAEVVAAVEAIVVAIENLVKSTPAAPAPAPTAPAPTAPSAPSPARAAAPWRKDPEPEK